MSSTHVDMSDVLKGLYGLRARGRDLRPVFRQVRTALKEDVQDHFARREGPASSWPEKSAATLARALERRGFKRKRGKLRGTLTKRGERWAGNLLGRLKWPSAHKITIRRTSMAMTARTGWAGVHQFGGVVGHGSVIQARPFMWASDKLQDTFEHALIGHLLAGWSHDE